MRSQKKGRKSNAFCWQFPLWRDHRRRVVINFVNGYRQDTPLKNKRQNTLLFLGQGGIMKTKKEEEGVFQKGFSY